MNPFSGIDRDECRGGVGLVRQRLRDRLPRRDLHAPVDGRVDAEAAGPDGAGAVLLVQLLEHVREEVRLANPRVEPAGPRPQRRRQRRLELGAGDVAVRVHRPEDVVAPCDRPLGRLDRVVLGRRLRQTGEGGGLDEREVPRPLREVRLRRRLDPVRVAAVEDLVQVAGEDPVLRPLPVELDREAGLLDLALERPLVRHRVEVAHELLRDGRAALDDAPGLDVLHQRAGDALEVDAAVLVEAAVLDRDRRLREPRAHLLERDGLPVPLGRDRPQEGVVGGVDERVLADRDGTE